MLRTLRIFALVSMLALTACAGGGGGGAPIVTPPGQPEPPPPPPPPPPPYASNCAATPGAVSCQTTGTVWLDGSQYGLRWDGAISTYTFERPQIFRKGTLQNNAEDIYVFGYLGGASVIYRYYTNLKIGNDGLGPVRVGENIFNDIGGFRPGDSSKLTLFDITNVLQGGLDYIQLGKVSPNPVNGAHTFFALARTASVPAMPSTGSARFAGGTRGVYTNGANVAFSTASDVSLTANFAAGTVAGATSNFKMIDANGVAATAPTDLNFNFSGNIAGAKFSAGATNTVMFGDVQGAFYGEPGGAPVEAAFSYSLSSSNAQGSLMGVGGLKKD